MIANRHIINRVFVEVETSSEQEANWVKNNSGSFFQDDVLPSVERLFERYDLGQTFRFEKLKLAVHAETATDLESIRQAIESQLENKLLQLRNAKNFEQEMANVEGQTESFITKNERSNEGKWIDPDADEQEVFLYFLLTGNLPWHARRNQIETLGSKENWKIVIKSDKFREKLLSTFQQNKIATRRFVLQFSAELVIHTLKSFGLIKSSTKLSNFLKKVPENSSQLFLEAFVLQLFRHEVGEELWFRCLAILIQHNPLGIDEISEDVVGLKKQMTEIVPKRLINLLFSDKIEQRISKLEPGQHNSIEKWAKMDSKLPENNPTIKGEAFVNFESEKGSEVEEASNCSGLVDNAGMILFHPFIKTFFEHNGWLNPDNSIQEKYKMHAVQALHYCATGKVNFFEADMIFEKFLCNVPLNQPLSAKSLLSKEEKQEADLLLLAVVKNWKALKNTSANGLRQLFVHRQGKLTTHDQNYKLTVERKVQDVLLEKLPWNISIVKLPWKKELIFVEW
ncbi:contractile injection system tape measure protein [uncultured Draconibacterium sp.]|uniref:contractile injection system tape measure protein n=1 Tax=uncultured Draconibacterium sp. TaxID=1573823 RepID=UPI0025F3469F|nr:contractile injection system tape measure protein [uncultured Draconibacterium sp.]